MNHIKKTGILISEAVAMSTLFRAALLIRQIDRKYMAFLTSNDQFFQRS